MTTVVELTEIYKEFFKMIDSTIFYKFVEIFNITEKQQQLKDYENFKEYCIKNPTKLFDAIDCLYPLLPDTNLKSIIHTLKLHFKEDKLIMKFLNQYSDKIMGLVDYEYISNTVKQILKCLLVQILQYHGIFNENDKKKKLGFLIKKEYLHRNNNII